MFVLLQGLKSHAVTMFEVGKLSDESMDSFLSELEKVRDATLNQILLSLQASSTTSASLNPIFYFFICMRRSSHCSYLSPSFVCDFDHLPLAVSFSGS